MEEGLQLIILYEAERGEGGYLLPTVLGQRNK